MKNDWEIENNLKPIDLSQFQKVTNRLDFNVEEDSTLLIVKIQDATFIIRKEEKK